MQNIYLSLGSNLGKRREQIEKALTLLQTQAEITDRSSFYETEPVGVTDQPLFINMVCEIEIDMTPQELMAFCQKIEEQVGRQNRGKWQAREIDIDIIYYGQLIASKQKLIIPHPEMHKRNFVLEPLDEIAPRFKHPESKKTTVKLLRECEDSSIVQKL